MDLNEVISVILDVLLVVAAVIAYQARPRIGGELARGLRVLMGGVIVLGLVHLIETALFDLFNVEKNLNEVLHRGLVGGAFVMIIFGFLIMRRAFER